MKPHTKFGPGERGIALVMALVSLLVVAVIAMVLMTSLTVERKISGGDLRDSQALNAAEAGVGEAMSRIRNFDISLSQANPRSVAQIFLTTAGNVPVLGTDSVGIETKQPAGAWLTYSTPNKSRDALTVEFKTNAARTAIYRYDATRNPAVQFVSGLPVYHITSTGTRGPNRVRIVTDVIQKPFNSFVHAAFAADQSIKFSGTSFLCGLNHRGDTPTGTTGRDGVVNANGDCDEFETHSGDLPGGWSSGAVTTTGASVQNGTPPTTANHVGEFYAGPWDMFGMGQSEFYAWMGAPVSTEPSPPNGIFYIDNNSTFQDRTGSFALHGGDGEGMLYVDGDLTLNGNLNYRGVIYVEGDIQVNGNFWLLGALVCKGKTTIKLANGSCTILYSSDAIAQALSKYGGQFVTLGWREVPLN